LGSRGSGWRNWRRSASGIETVVGSARIKVAAATSGHGLSSISLETFEHSFTVVVDIAVTLARHQGECSGVVSDDLNVLPQHPTTKLRGKRGQFSSRSIKFSDFQGNESQSKVERGECELH
jgi:hypothetical protein